MLDIREQLDTAMLTSLTGSVVQTIGMTAAVADFPAPIGATVELERQTGECIEGEVIGFRDQYTLVYPMRGIAGVRRGNRVRLVRTSRSLPVGDGLLGRIIDGLGRTSRGSSGLDLPSQVSTHRQHPNSQRPAIQRGRG